MLQKELIYTSLSFGLNFVNISYMIFYVDDRSSLSSEVLHSIAWSLCTLATELSKAIVFTQKEANALDSIKWWSVLACSILQAATQFLIQAFRPGWIIRGFITISSYLNLTCTTISVGIIEYKLYTITSMILESSLAQSNHVVCSVKNLRKPSKYFRAVWFGMLLLSIKDTLEHGFEFMYTRLGPPCKPELFQ